MSVSMKGHILNQRQLDAIVPVMNDLMQRRVSQKGFEKACIAALEAAGCALGYDTSMPGADKTVTERGEAWLLNGQVGMSSKSIYYHMTGREPEDGYSYPRDPGDLNRCLLLLDLIPEWRSRMPEMAAHGKQWAGLVADWPALAGCFIREVGLNWCNGKCATETYALMKKVMGEQS
jgi:hypothetical protein